MVGYKNKLSGMVFAGLTMVSGAASAATIDFTLNSSPQVGPLTFGNGTDSVDVTAARVDLAGAPVAGTALIASYGSQNGGLGICTSGYNPHSTGSCDTTLGWHPLDLSADSHLVDGYGLFGFARPEMAFLDFGAEVVDLLSITFNYVGDGDTFKLLSDLFPTQTSQTIASGAFRQTFTLTSPLRGSVFGIGAAGLHDNFKIKSIAYNVVMPVSPVPLPAAGLLLMGALAGAGALRRRKTA